jgi:hypothetical protein
MEVVTGNRDGCLKAENHWFQQQLLFILTGPSLTEAVYRKKGTTIGRAKDAICYHSDSQ